MEVVRPWGYKTISCSTQLHTKFQLHIKFKIPTNEEVSCFKSLRDCTFYANKCLTFMSRIISCSAELSMKKVL